MCTGNELVTLKQKSLSSDSIIDKIDLNYSFNFYLKHLDTEHRSSWFILF